MIRPAFIILLTGIALNSYVPPAAADSGPAAEAVVQFCPQSDKFPGQCDAALFPPQSMFGDPEFDPWTKKYHRAEPCRLWWWAEYVRSWGYQPLIEWSKHMQSALRDGLSPQIIFGILGYAPQPPIVKFDNLNNPKSVCTPPTAQDWLFLSEKIRRLNLSRLSPELLLQMTKHCLAFEVEAALWKRVNSNVVSSYVIPIGDIYFVVLAQSYINKKDILTQRPDNYVVANEDFGVTFTTVGHCPITVEPAKCVEGFIQASEEKSTFGYPNGMTHSLSGLADRAELLSLFGGGGVEKPFALDLRIEPSGIVEIFFVHPNEKRSRARLKMNAEGELIVETDERLCDADTAKGKPLVLAPVAFSKEVMALFKEVSVYEERDFPLSKRYVQSGVEKGCPGTTYPKWAAETANAAKHYARLGVPWDTLYRSTALQRLRWKLQREGLPSLQENLIYGKWREEKIELPLEYGSTFEKNATTFVKTGSNPQEAQNIMYRRLFIDDVAATEVWYYPKPVEFWPGQKKSGHIIMMSLNNHDEIYSRSVIAKLVQLSSSCLPIKEHKKGFLAAMYALFNAAPLEKGSDNVSKVYMAAAYHYLYGYKLREMRKLTEIDFDAQTMSIFDFIEKYLPVITE